MKKVCSFEINNKTYTIYDIDKIEGRESIVGRSHYDKRTILIEEGSKEHMLMTLKHELMHVWLYEYGFKYQDGGCFSYEELCEYSAQAYDFINKIVNEYNTHSAIAERNV